jgi:hypothetical protein
VKRCKAWSCSTAVQQLLGAYLFTVVKALPGLLIFFIAVTRHLFQICFKSLGRIRRSRRYVGRDTMGGTSNLRQWISLKRLLKPMQGFFNTHACSLSPHWDDSPFGSDTVVLVAGCGLDQRCKHVDVTKCMPYSQAKRDRLVAKPHTQDKRVVKVSRARRHRTCVERLSQLIGSYHSKFALRWASLLSVLREQGCKQPLWLARASYMHA